MNKRINSYFFGEPGTFDEYNPVYVCNKNFAPEILYLIAEVEPFSSSKNDIIKKLNINEEVFNDVISSLIFINAIEMKNNKFKLNFTIFLERDIQYLKKYFSDIDVGRIIGEKIIEKNRQLHEKISKITSHSCFRAERLLYHIICDSIFDDTAFDFFTEKGLFLHSKQQPGNRDYIIFGYEDNEIVEEFSKLLLCSSNNYKSNNFVFNSFGDSNGTRKDMFRFFRNVIRTLENITPYKNLNFTYIKLIERKNSEIAEKCGNLLLRSIRNNLDLNNISEDDQTIAYFLHNLGYINIDEYKAILCNVPVFEYKDIEVINEISKIILDDIFEDIKNIFEKFEKNENEITPIKHKVNIKEISVDLWHMIFGLTNEFLIKSGFIELPEYKSGEGRYLQSFILNESMSNNQTTIKKDA